MKDDVRISIDARKSSLDTMYELTDSLKKEIDTLFYKIYEFGKTCNDSMDFESKFAASQLNKEYIDMFTKVATTCKAKELPQEENVVPSTGEKVLNDLASDAKYLADDLTLPARRKARMEMESKLRSTPLGKIEQAENTFWLLKKFKKKKPDKSSEE